MPIRGCSHGGRPGFKFGDQGRCYTYNPENEASKSRARDLAERQGAAIKASQAMRGRAGGA